MVAHYCDYCVTTLQITDYSEAMRRGRKLTKSAPSGANQICGAPGGSSLPESVTTNIGNNCCARRTRSSLPPDEACESKAAPQASRVSTMGLSWSFAAPPTPPPPANISVSCWFPGSTRATITCTTCWHAAVTSGSGVGDTRDFTTRPGHLCTQSMSSLLLSPLDCCARGDDGFTAPAAATPASGAVALHPSAAADAAAVLGAASKPPSQMAAICSGAAPKNTGNACAPLPAADQSRASASKARCDTGLTTQSTRTTCAPGITCATANRWGESLAASALWVSCGMAPAGTTWQSMTSALTVSNTKRSTQPTALLGPTESTRLLCPRPHASVPRSSNCPTDCASASSCREGLEPATPTTGASTTPDGMFWDIV